MVLLPSSHLTLSDLRGLSNMPSGDGSSMVLFAWRFVPTLVAVLYIQITVTTFEDIERTEPFDRLASSTSGGATAYRMLLLLPKSWWSTSCDMIFRRKQMGKTG